MTRKRRTHSAGFKARVASEALKGVKAVNQIAREEGVPPVRVSTWKKELQGKLPALFESGARHRHDEEKAGRDRARLERKVGQLTIGKEFPKKVRAARDRSERKTMIEPGHGNPSIHKQARLLGVNRSRLGKKPHPPRADRAGDQEVLAAIDRLHTRWPFHGQRKLRKESDKLGPRVHRKRLRRLMEAAGIVAIAPKRWTSMPNAAHRKYPPGSSVPHASGITRLPDPGKLSTRTLRSDELRPRPKDTESIMRKITEKISFYPLTDGQPQHR